MERQNAELDLENRYLSGEALRPSDVIIEPVGPAPAPGPGQKPKAKGPAAGGPPPKGKGPRPASGRLRTR